MDPLVSEHFQIREPSAIRLTQIEFLKRRDQVTAINTAIGNVSLPMHPAMAKRMFTLGTAPDSPFRQGVVKYSTTIGEVETNLAFLHLLASSGLSTEGVYSQITDGGSQAMELVILGICGPAGSGERPLLVIDPTYSNYFSMAERTGRSLAVVTRHLAKEGTFNLPTLAEIEAVIAAKKPGGLLVIPYDNPTGQFFSQTMLDALGQLCVKHNLWLVSDEAYREVFYTEDQVSSVWGISEKKVPGIRGRRISIESASKLWNACGLRIGALLTDNAEFHEKAVAENTANLCSSAIGQYIFGSLLHESKEQLQSWFQQQRSYYHQVLSQVTSGLKQEIPRLIVSKPEASLYTVIDMRDLFDKDFDVLDFVLYCAREGKVELEGVNKTLLMAPMAGFYSPTSLVSNPGKTQVRIAYVEPPEVMAQVPRLFAQLVSDFSKIYLQR